MLDTKKLTEHIDSLSGPQFENLVQEILKEAGFSDVIKQTSGSQGGFDIKAILNGVEWRFEAKHKKNQAALAEKDLADKFDQIEANPGNVEYYIIVTNGRIGNELRSSIQNHRDRWYIDLDYWSACNDKFNKLSLSYPETVIRQLNLPESLASQLRHESASYLKAHRPFLEEAIDHLLKNSNRFTLLQRVADDISKSQFGLVRPSTDFNKLVERKSANAAFDRFKKSNVHSCLFLIAKEQMGKTSLMRLWAASVKKDNIVFFINANRLYSEDWMKKLQDLIYAGIEKNSLSPLQCPRYLSTILERIQSRLQAKNAFFYIFVDALNAAEKAKIEKFFESSEFKDSLNLWRFNWVFSCRESTWIEWKQRFTLPENHFDEYALGEFSDKELEGALSTHVVEKSIVPHWLWPKLKWPGLLRITEIIQAENPKILRDMPEMTLAQISLMFIKERLDDFAKFHPGGRQLSTEGIEKFLNEILSLFSEQGYRSLPFKNLHSVEDFRPHDLSQDAWNILLQQGFLTKRQNGRYELGNDWGIVLIGKYFMDTLVREDVAQSDQALLIARIFDGIAPLSPEGGVSIDDYNKLEDILWFALHYAKTQRISEPIFGIILDNAFSCQNLHLDYLSKTAARLFPEYSVRYLSTLADDTRAFYMREGLEQLQGNIVIREVIKVFPDAPDNVKVQLAILLEHHKDGKFLDDVFELIDKGLLPHDENEKLRVKGKLLRFLYHFPDECCALIQRRLDDNRLSDYDSAIHLVGINGTAKQTNLLKALMKRFPATTPTTLRAMGQLRMKEVEPIAMDLLSTEDDLNLQAVAIEALGHLQSARFLDWCKSQDSLWKRKDYPFIIQSLQLFKSSEAYDCIISLEIQQKDWIPFISFYQQNRLRRLNKNQFNNMVLGLVNKIERSNSANEIWRGLSSLSSLNNRRFSEWWREYRDTNIPNVVAGLARQCSKQEYFTSGGKTEGSMAMDEALKILELIGDRDVLVALLLDLMKMDIPALFAFTLVPIVIKYIDPCFKDILFSIAKQRPITEKDTASRDIAQGKAVTCLTYLSGDDVFDVILNERGKQHSEDENSLLHFKSDYTVQRVVDVIRTQDGDLFWSAYLFLWDFQAEESIEHCFNWLQSLSSDDWKYKYLLRYLFRLHQPTLNEHLLGHLNEPDTLLAVSDIITHSKDPQMHDWFIKQIKLYSTMGFAYSDKGLHEYLLRWIYLNSYKECTKYLRQFVEANERDCLLSASLMPSVYTLIGKFELWEFAEPIKSRYYRWNQHWSRDIIEATLTLIYIREPEWAWQEFLKFWGSSSDSDKKEAVAWVGLMLSENSVAWMIDLYPNIGEFFSNEKEIKRTIRKICGELPEALKDFGTNIIERKANSPVTKDRIEAAVCSGLFGESVYIRLGALLEDECVRVREMYQYAAISGENEE